MVVLYLITNYYENIIISEKDEGKLIWQASQWG